MTGELSDGGFFASCAATTAGMHRTQKKAINHAPVILVRLLQDKGVHLGGVMANCNRMLVVKKLILGTGTLWRPLEEDTKKIPYT